MIIWEDDAFWKTEKMEGSGVKNNWSHSQESWWQGQVSYLLWSFYHTLRCLQVHSPAGAASLIGSGMGPHFIFAEGDSEFREHGTDTIRCHMRSHTVHTFGSQDSADDVLSSHKLQEPLPAGKHPNSHTQTYTHMILTITNPNPLTIQFNKNFIKP